LSYTDAIPNYDNIITYRITWIVLGTFVFISGYFLGKKNIDRTNLVSFYKKRFVRIYPPYLIAIFIFSILGLYDNTTSIKAIFGMSMFIRPAPGNLWFITMLLFFYIICPICLYFLKKSVIHYLLFFITIISILSLYEYLSNEIFNYYYLDIRIITYLVPFMLGIFTANNNYTPKKNILIITSILFFIFSCSVKTKNMNLLLATPLISTSSLLLFTIFNKLTIKQKYTQKTILFLSTSSYFMYLYHRPLYMVCKNIFFPKTQLMQLFYLVTVCIFIIIPLSYLMQMTYNKTITLLMSR